ncbi:hypothetical protein N7520_009998 [Penicillium odoratum]|uniref:uncharacterized protein n=1 Tax=Penicillium odoratum TaxID=1167516 RepID=UPI002548162D|nr:uncharacterized protein N7520_009998 [Penicillium odoratum]KAJ5753081.1 hypothetical protein N7520_009998 [Penicillium odoratum]
MGSEMDTFSARLASFDVVLKPEKRRSSGVKGPRFIAWPHSKPSPTELAQAGFFYKPYESNPDNTTCFECGRALDGWEEEDNPITEHLKHSPDCGWAITMDIQQNSSNPSAIEDPTSDRITQARLATFGSAWPHDEKPGWICQSEKMVEGGWYFCPTEESDDLASCAYCKLSLDGWEPTDDPFEEHYRRSSECSFFVFAQPPGKKGKGSKLKNPRVSKASSRLSTQSVGTTTSEAPDMDDESMDQSIISQTSAKPKPTKKGAKGKGKSKNKKEEVEADSQMEIDSVEPEPEPEAPKIKRTGRGKKRVSEEMARDESEPLAEPELSIEPPSKRRNTRTRSSSVSQAYSEAEYEMPDAAPIDEAQEEPKKSRKGSKKTSKGHKASDASVASKSTSKSRLPRDSELDAAIEAGLEADEPEPVEPEPPIEPEPEPEPEPEVEPAPRAKKTKTSKKTKAAKATEPARELEDSSREEQPEASAEPAVDTMDVTEELAEPAPKAKAVKGKKKGTKKTKKEESKSKTPKSRESDNKVTPDDQLMEEQHASFVSVEIISQERKSEREPEPQPEPQAEPEPELQPEPEAEPEVHTPEKPVTKKSSKKEDKAKKSKKSKKKEPSPSPEPVVETVEEPISEEQPMSPSVDEEWGTPDDLPDQLEMLVPAESSPEPTKQRTPVPPKTAKRFSDIPQEDHLTESITKSQDSRGRFRRASQASRQSMSPLPAHQHTPSMSPQSSDAENRPPSSRPSTSRPAAPPAEPQDRTPRAAATPSPSKHNFNGGFPASGHPWTPVDIDEVLFGDSSDKENADLSGLFKRGLTSPEKKMTVEEWIKWNAKNGEERLKRECERLVSQFEKEGSRGMQRLEAIECID